MDRAASFEDSLLGDFSFPQPAVELNGDSALELISASLPLAEGIINKFREKIKLMSSRVKAVGAGALTNFLHRKHDPKVVHSKVLGWIDRAVQAKNGLFKLHMKAIETDHFMGLLLDTLQDNEVVDIDEILKQNEITVSADDWHTVKEVLEFVAWKQRLSELQGPFMNGYRILDEHLQELRNQLQRYATLISNAEPILSPKNHDIPTVGIQFAPWAIPVLGNTVVPGPESAAGFMNEGTQPATGAFMYDNPIDTHYSAGFQGPFGEAWASDFPSSFAWYVLNMQGSNLAPNTGTQGRGIDVFSRLS